MHPTLHEEFWMDIDPYWTHSVATALNFSPLHWFFAAVVLNSWLPSVGTIVEDFPAYHLDFTFIVLEINFSRISVLVGSINEALTSSAVYRKQHIKKGRICLIPCLQFSPSGFRSDDCYGLYYAQRFLDGANFRIFHNQQWQRWKFRRGSFTWTAVILLISAATACATECRRGGSHQLSLLNNYPPSYY